MYEKLLIEQIPTLAHAAYHHTMNNEDAEDLLQDTMLLLLKKIDTYDDLNFGGWSYTLLHNLYRNRLRQQCIIEGVEDLTEYHALYESKGIESYDIEQCIEQLSQPNAIALKMYLSGYQYNEIASQLDISIGTVKSRISRSRSQLQAMLKDYR